MKWYSDFLSVFEKPFSHVPPDIIADVREKLKSKQAEEPLASVVLIAHNEECRIFSCLWSLCENRCDYPIEIFVVNNNSTDRTEEVLKTLGAPYLNEEKKGPGYSRRRGLNHARGKYHICIDADTLYPPRYIQTHIEALMKPGVVCAFGLWSFIPDANYSAPGLRMFEALRDLHLRVQAIKRPELCVRGMALSFDAGYGRKVGFRTDIIRGEDGSLALGLKRYGKLKLLSARKSRVLTSNGTLSADGSLWNSFKVRAVKAVKGLDGLFSTKRKYDDEDSNLIKP